MEEDQAARILSLENSQQKMMKSQENLENKLNEMMAILAELNKGKRTTQDDQPQGHVTIDEDPLYPPGFTPPYAHQGTTSIPPTGVLPSTSNTPQAPYPG